MPYPLSQLEAEFLKCSLETAGPFVGRDLLSRVATLAEADGIMFMCPKCFETNGHQVRVFFRGRGAPDRLGKNSKGVTVRWNASGTGLADLVLTPSIQIEGCCGWHGFVGSSGIPPGHAG